MMKSILVPLDGSKFAERAISPAVALASRVDAELHLVSVISDLPPVALASSGGDLISRWFNEEEERAQQYLDGVKRSIEEGNADARVSTHIRVGAVTESLEEVGTKLGVDLMMLTSHGRGAWQRAWLGSVADQLLRRSVVPLLLLRDEGGALKLFADPMYPRHVIIPLDGSEAAESVIPLFGALLAESGTRITLVSVLHQPFPLATTYLPHAVSEEGLMHERKASAEDYLETVAEGVRNRVAGSVDTRVIVDDDAARSILDFAEREGVDLIALSTRGRGGVTRFFVGSVADKLVRGSKVPMLTVRRPAEEEEAG